MKIAILGTRGIPNHHGGFEQFADFFSKFLFEENYDISVYCSSLHPYKENNFEGVKLIHCYDPEDKIGTAGQFIYDLNCILDSRKRNFDVILQLGYTSSSIWHFLMPKKSIIITNMDGLEWKRSKYSNKVQKFLKYAEKLAANNSDFLISDSIGIQNYLKDTYNKDSEYIAYGADLFNNPEESILEKYNLIPYEYNLLIARMEPENNIETIIKGVIKSKNKNSLILIGNHTSTKFGNYLFEKYSNNEKIKFIGGIYNLNDLNNLRYFSQFYFHGHSVGGTNPSLLEAMASDSLIIANNNIFNKSILENDAYYFLNEEDIANILDLNIKKDNCINLINNNRNKINNFFSWENINNNYIEYIHKCIKK